MPARVPAYPALARFSQAAGPVLVLGDLVPATPAPEGLAGRLPVELETAWLAMLARYQDEFRLSPEQVLERLDRAGEYLKAGGFGWVARGAAGVALHALLSPRQGLFLRLMAEAGSWDGGELARPRAAAPPAKHRGTRNRPTWTWEPRLGDDEARRFFDEGTNERSDKNP